MKNIVENIVDFFTGGFFNYLGAFFRMPFTKTKYLELVKENQSNNVGMLVTAVLIFAVFAYIKFSI